MLIRYFPVRLFKNPTSLTVSLFFITYKRTVQMAHVSPAINKKSAGIGFNGLMPFALFFSVSNSGTPPIYSNNDGTIELFDRSRSNFKFL